MANTLTHLMSPYYTERWPNPNLMYTLDHTLVTVVRNSYAHARNRLRMLMVTKSEAETSNISKFQSDMQGNGPFTTDSQGPIQTSDSDPRTWMFLQTRVTAGNSACSVTGVLVTVICHHGKVFKEKAKKCQQ